MELKIPGREPLCLEHILFDYNGTLALDGKLIEGASARLITLADSLTLHVITADTFGTVASALEGVPCRLKVIPPGSQAQSKLDYLLQLGKEKTLTVGNGANDALMLREAAIGCALLQQEGLATAAWREADIVFHSLFDLFDCLADPRRMIATLRE
jgi:soluble P-type ATPase